MNDWPQQLKNNLLEWLCFNVDDCFTWHSLALTNKFCSIKCREFAPLKKREFSRKIYTNDGYEEETTYYLPGTGEAHGFQIAKYNKSDRITIREDWYQNGFHRGRWFTDIIKETNIIYRSDVYYYQECENYYQEYNDKEKMFVIRKTFIYLSFDVYNNKITFFHVPKEKNSIMGDVCDYCYKLHSFHVLNDFNTISPRLVYSKNCLDTTYKFELFENGEEYYKRLKRCRIARKVCDYDKQINNII